MKTATSLTLVAIGAILTFAVTAHLSFLNLQVAGVVIMAVGVAGLLLRRRGFDWHRRRIVLRRGRRGPVVAQVDETDFPSYVMIDPASLQSVQPLPAVDDLEPPTIQETPESRQETEQTGDNRRSPSSDTTLIEESIME